MGRRRLPDPPAITKAFIGDKTSALHLDARSLTAGIRDCRIGRLYETTTATVYNTQGSQYH